MYFIFILLYFDNQCLGAWADGTHVDVSVKNTFTGSACLLRDTSIPMARCV